MGGMLQMPLAKHRHGTANGTVANSVANWRNPRAIGPAAQTVTIAGFKPSQTDGKPAGFKPNQADSHIAGFQPNQTAA